jgi:hypothetical protein
LIFFFISVALCEKSGKLCICEMRMSRRRRWGGWGVGGLELKKTERPVMKEK